jgi:maltose/maltodextrin transport system substrate-binding protein
VKKQIIRSIASITLLSTPFVFANEGELRIWLNADKGYNGLRDVGKQFTEDTGVEVIVEIPDSVTEKFQQEAAIGKGPDIFIWAHDRFGGWAQSGLIAQVDPSASLRNALDDSFWGAVTYNGAIYGYPISIEGPTQICNADIVEKPFASFNDINKQAGALLAKGKTPIVWDFNDTYFTYGMITSEGGYAFKNVDGTYDPTQTGVANAGAVKGLQAIKGLIDSETMPNGMDRAQMDAAFLAGDVACVINGPWAWADYQKGGIDILIGPYPTVSGGTPAGFIGVLSATINASSPDKDLASEFIESYLLQEDGLKMVDDDRALGAVTHKAFMEKLSNKNPILGDAFRVWQTSEPMPNIPAMGAFWSNMGPAITAITQGRQSVEDALNDAAERIIR